MFDFICKRIHCSSSVIIELTDIVFLRLLAKSINVNCYLKKKIVGDVIFNRETNVFG